MFSMFQVDLEEHKIKEENYINEDSSDNEDDTHSVCMDEENDHVSGSCRKHYMQINVQLFAQIALRLEV